VTGPAQRPIEDALAIAGSAAETVQRALTAVVVEVSFTVGTTSGPELWRVRRLANGDTFVRFDGDPVDLDA